MKGYLDVVYGRRQLSDYPLRLGEKLSQGPLKGLQRVLDLGCGDETFTRVLRGNGHDAVGLDRRMVKSNGEVIHCDFEKDRYHFDDASFDAVFTKSVIEHVSRTDHFCSEIARLLKDKGRVVIMTPSWEYTFREFYSDPTHVRPFHRKGLQRALAMAGFEEIRVEYFYQLPVIWQMPAFRHLASLTRWLVPDAFKWKNREEIAFRPWIRFSKEIMLLATATRPSRKQG